jgi:hypothetical protein
MGTNGRHYVEQHFERMQEAQLFQQVAVNLVQRRVRAEPLTHAMPYRSDNQEVCDNGELHTDGSLCPPG